MRALIITLFCLPAVLHCSAQNCVTIQNLPDTIRQCKNTIAQVSPSLLFTGQFTPFDTTWSPSFGLSNPNVINPNINVGTASTSYKLTILALSPANLVVNGDFNSGNSGFTSSYSLGTGGTWGPGSNPGTFGVTNDPINMHSLWASFGDHTTGTGQMFTVNGAQATNVNVWCQTVNVSPNTLYDFSTWIASVSPSSPAILQFAINGSPLGVPFNAPAATGQWAQFHNTWMSGSSATATICITNQNTAFVGNDFALDDIQFREACAVSDSVYVEVVNTLQSFSNVSLCQGKSLVFGGQTITTAGTYSHTFSTSSGCDSIVTLSVKVSPSTLHSHTIDLCEGSSILFGGQLITLAGTYSHTFPTLAGCDSTVNLSVKIIPAPKSFQTLSVCKDSIFTMGGVVIDSAGTYNVAFKTLAGCDSIVALTVIRTSPPNVDFSFYPLYPILNEPTVFNNKSTNASAFFWDFGDNSSSTEKNPTHLYPKSGTYTTCLTGWSDDGCKNTKCRKVDAEIFASIDVPTAFSPNGDGVNDVLFVRGAGIKHLTFIIFNRWGQKVFSTNDLTRGWDGRYNGQLQNLETYAYVVTAEFVTGETVQKKGNITLL